MKATPAMKIVMIAIPQKENRIPGPAIPEFELATAPRPSHNMDMAPVQDVSGAR